MRRSTFDTLKAVLRILVRDGGDLRAARIERLDWVLGQARISNSEVTRGTVDRALNDYYEREK